MQATRIPPCDLSSVEDRLEQLWPPGAFRPGIEAARDERYLSVRVVFRGMTRPHRLFVDADDDRLTGMWTFQSGASASGWDLMSDAHGVLHRHDGVPTVWRWTPVEHQRYARSARAGTTDYRLPADLLGPRVRIGVLLGDAEWTPPAFLPGTASPRADETAEPGPPRTPQRFAIHYGARPWLVRGCTAPDEAADVYAQFGHAAFGAGLESPEHPYHDRAADLVAAIRARNSTEVWGYVSLVGGPTDPGGRRRIHTVAEILERIRGWRALGATGILLDEADQCRPDWQPCPLDPDAAPVAITGERQRAVVDGIHALGLAVCANAHAFVDVAAILRGPTGGHPADLFLMESPTLHAGVRRSPIDTAVADATFELARRLRKRSGVRFAAVDTHAGAVDDGASRMSVFRDAWSRATAAGVDAYGFTNADYSAPPELESNLALYDLPAVG